MAISNLDSLTLEQRIDALGQLKAQLATMLADEKLLKDSIVEEVGVGAFEGDTFRVSISASQRETLDMEAVRKHLSPQFIRAHTNITDTTTVRVTARKGV